MKDLHENKLSMYYTVSAFFNAHISELSATLPAIETTYSEYIDLLTELESELTVSTLKNKGYAEQKKVYREILRSKTLELSAVIKAYFLINNNKQMAEKYAIGKSAFDKKRDAELHHLCDSLHEVALVNAANLVTLGFNDLRIAEIKTAYSNFHQFISQPREVRKASANATVKAGELFKLVDEKLDLMDALMLSISSQFERYFIQYTYNRNIVSTGAKKKKSKTKRYLLQPNSVTLVLEISYLPNRAFKLVNHSDEVVFWNLSTLNDRFVAAWQPVDAHSESRQLSSKLASSGDYLLVSNPSGSVVEVEIGSME